MKVKAAYNKQIEDDFELDLGYEEWLRDNHNEPSEVEIINMARESLSTETFVNLMWHIFAANNTNYNPHTNKGA